ncbi:MAG: T9SS type A sorting domain-containing protein [Bacteroidales bacterium]|nr:T9SS type A sorting domain-containing protein [Bacteroidales bacterium]
MKKLLSICFLSIFLMMFGMQAQAQRDCCFQLSNPHADTLHGIANLPGGNLPLSHYMSPLVFGATDVYDMIFSDANCLGIDEGAKVSVELELWVDGPNGLENVLDGQHDLSRYCNITLQTAYEELHWVGTPMLQENYSFVYEYPGAIPIFSGTYNISNVAFDYFYFRFLTNTRSRIVVTWNQVFRDVMLIVHIRERIHGTDNSLYWNSHVEESEYYQIGGHQSHPGRVLASDTLTPGPIVEKNDTIKDCEPVTVGMPPYTMDTTGDYRIAYVDTTCGYRIDSVVNYNYTHYVHPTTPTLSDSTYTYCQRATSDSIVLGPEPNDSLRIDHGADIVAYWSLDGDTFYYAPSFTPNTDTLAGTYTYYVKRHDNVTGCESGVDTFQVRITPIPAGPSVTDTLVEYCVGETPVALTYTAPAGQQVLWGEDVDNITSTTAPVPTATAAGTKVYYLKLQDTTTVNQCISDDYDSITVKVYDNPTVAITIDNDTLCFGDVASMTAAPTDLTTYQWKEDGVNVADSTNYHFSYTNDVTDTTLIVFSVAVTKLHVVKSCSGKDSVEVLAYPTIGAPTPVRGDTAICGPGTVTREVANGAHASTSTWYDKTKTIVLGTGTTYTQNYTETDTLYVSSSNDFGCETPKANWLCIIVTVDSVPQITLTTDHVGDSVCAEENLIIRSSVVPTGYVLDYVWSGTGLVAPLNRDSVVFNYATAGTYTDTLTVTIHYTTPAHQCSNHATIDITVDTLPVIVKDVNYTVKNNDYCVGVNGKIEFTTPDYVRYSIDSAATWQPSKVFAPLAAGDYYLVVEDGNGCKNHANHEVIIDAPIKPVLTLADSANTRCEAPFNGKLIAHATPAATYNYQLNDGAFQADSVFAALEDGAYTVIVKDMTTGCRDTATHNVTNGRVTPDPTLVQNPNTHCVAPFGGSIAVVAMNPADEVYQYCLVKGTDTSAYQYDTLFTSLEHGFYTVIAKDTATACLGNDTITVKYNGVLPTATITALPEICYGDTNLVSMVPGGADVVFDNWEYSGPVPTTDPMIVNVLDKQSFSMKGFPAGKHTFTAHFHDTVTHCTNTVTDTLRVIPVNIDLITIPYDAHVCSYDSLKVYCRYFPDDAVKDHIVTYNWYAREYHYAGGFDTVWVSPAYDNRRVSIVVYDNHGCSNSKFIDLNVWQLPALTINTDEQNYCENATSNITVVPSSAAPYTYAWKKNGTVLTGETSSHLAIPVGTADFNVTVTVTDNHSCVNDSTFNVNVIEVPGHPNFDPATQYFCDNNVTITYGTPAQANPAIGTFTWLNDQNPETDKADGTYRAYYVNTENGVSCYSDTSSVVVDITGAPHFDVAVRYNSEIAIDTMHNRCYEVGAGDTIHVNVTPAAGTVYTFKKNNVAATKDMIITRTDAGSYIDTITIHAVATHGSVQCENDTTIYYYLTIHALPGSAPSDFPLSYNGGDSTIFHCEGSTPSYSFTADANTVLHYDSPTGTTIPTTNGSHTLYVTRTDVTPNCTNTFPYKIVEVPIPTVLVTSKDASSLCGGTTFEDTIVATITNAIDASYSRLFTWNAGTEIVKSDNADTLYHTFTQSDTVVVKVGVRAENGTYSATCYKTPLDSVKIVFQALPDVPTYNATSFGYVGPDTAVYCEGATFTITPADFTTSTGAHVSIVGGNITAPGTYKVIANNDLAPNCPSADTLIFKLHQKRMPVIPVFDTVYYCAGSTPAYTITKWDANDTITYYNGSVLLAGQPDTAGVFTIHVEDKLEGCSKDSTLVIVEVALPTATITYSANWHNDSICEGSNINETYTITATPTVHYSGVETWSWKDVTSTTNTATLTATPTADTSVTFFYHLIDTIANSYSHVACAFDFDSTITYTFFETPKFSLLTKDTAFCAGDTVIITEDFFTLLTTGIELVPTPSLPDTFASAGGTVVAHVRYTSFTSCMSADSTITVTRNALPTVAIAPHNPTICYGDTSILKVTGADSYEWSTGATIDSIFAVDSIKYSVIGTDVNGCVNYDTVKVSFHPIFTVELSPDTTVCVGDSLMISATVTGTTAPFELTWYKNNVSFDIDGGVLSGIEMSKKVGPDSSAIVNGIPVPTLYKIGITDSYGCSRDADLNVIKVAASNRPAFIFRQIDSTKNIHSMEVSSGDAAGFEMYITNECHDETERVFVAVQIYKNGQPITNAELGTNMDFILSNYNTSYDFDVNHENAPALEHVGVKSCFFNQSEYFFPNSELINFNAYKFDWLFMHFLTTKSGSDPARKITVRTGAFKPEAKGVYTFSFAVIKAGPYTSVVGDVYKSTLKVGGYNGHVGLTALDTIAFDTFDIYVDSTFVGASTSPVISNQTVITTAPEESAAEKAMNMNVYPNPASNNVNVVLSGIEGQTVITVHDMSGKAVTSMKVELNDNNQIINLPVDNFSQGIYFIKAVNGSAVMTKKLIIAR